MEGKEPNIIQNPREQDDIARMRKFVLEWLANSKKEVKKAARPAPQPLARPAQLASRPSAVTQPAPTKNVQVIPQAKAVPTLPKTNGNAKKAGRPKRPLRVVPVLVAGLLVLIVALASSAAALYIFKVRNPILSAVTRVVPFPAAFVDFHPLSYTQWRERADELLDFQQRMQAQDATYAPPAQLEIERHALDRMIDQYLLERLARQFGVAVTSPEMDEELEKIVTEIGGRDQLSTQLDTLYRWNIEEFTREIVGPTLLKEKIQRAINLDERINQESLQRALGVLEKIRAGNLTFERIAQDYSEDYTALQGGELGYFSRGQMVPEFEAAA